MEGGDERNCWENEVCSPVSLTATSGSLLLAHYFSSSSSCITALCLHEQQEALSVFKGTLN